MKLNAITIDVEDYYMVSAFAKEVKFEDWTNYESRVVPNTRRILELLAEYDIKATFFVLGWVAKQYPKIIMDIHSAGHRIACHSYNHRLIYNLTPEEFREDLRKSKRILEDIIGISVVGFRAPTYSIIKRNLWALDVLIEEGFLYDSSIFPVFHDIYGIPGAMRFPHEIKRPSGMIKEFPLSTFQIKISKIKYKFPIAGGGYLRLLPVGLTKWAINYINNSEGQPVIIYFHPWEIDPMQPIINVGLRSRFRHYLNLDKTTNKLKVLLPSFKFVPIEEIIGV
ncbi:MAG: XrtA system polysaccharide deacetylase [Nitrospirota bacterium]